MYNDTYMKIRNVAMVSHESTSSSVWTLYNVTEHYMWQATLSDFNGTTSTTKVVESSTSRDDEHKQMIIIAVLTAFTLLGNMTLILVLLCKRSRRIKRVNVLLLNLAFGDLAVALFVNSTEILFLSFGDWPLGPAYCKISVYVQMVCLSSATNLLTAMSIDRYQVIVKPMQSLAKRPRIWLKIAIAWTLSLLFPIPQLFIFVQSISGTKPDGTPRRFCSSRGYTAAWQRKVYLTYTTLYILIIPMAIMLFCYAQIIRVVWIRANTETRRRSSCMTTSSICDTRSLNARPSFSSESARERSVANENSDMGCGCDGGAVKMKQRNGPTVRWARSAKDKKSSRKFSLDKNKRIRYQDFAGEDSHTGSPRMSVRRSLVTASKRRVLVMTLTVVVSFLVCHTPYFIIVLVRSYSDYKLTLKQASFVSEFLVMVHSTLNPILYGLFTLRQHHLQNVLAFLTCSPRVTPPQEQRLRQYSGERHRLLMCVKSKLSEGSTTTTTFVNSSNNTHTDPLLTREKLDETRKPNMKEKESSSSSLSSTSNLPKRRKTPKYHLSFSPNQNNQCSDAILFTNTEVVLLKNQDTEPDPSFRYSSDFLPQCTLIANSYILKSPGSSPLLHNNGRTEVKLRRQSGSGVKMTSGFPKVGHDVLPHSSIMPLSPKNVEGEVGGLTRV